MQALMPAHVTAHVAAYVMVAHMPAHAMAHMTPMGGRWLGEGGNRFVRVRA